MKLPFDPTIPLLGLYPRNSKTPIQKNLCTPVFIAVLFTIAKCQKQPKCPSVNEWVKKAVVHTQWNTMQQKGVPAFCDSVDGTENIMLSEITRQ